MEPGWTELGAQFHSACASLVNGRSALAPTDLKSGEVLISIPACLAISPGSKNPQPSERAGVRTIRDALQSVNLGLDHRSLNKLCTVVSLLHEMSLGKDSVLQSYVASLPTEFNTPLYWESTECELLAGSSINPAALVRAVTEYYERFFMPICDSNSGMFSESHSSRRSFFWAWSVVEAYGRFLTPMNGPHLVPFVHLFHLRPSSPNIEFSFDGSKFVVRVLRAVRSGDEVCGPVELLCAFLN